MQVYTTIADLQESRQSKPGVFLLCRENLGFYITQSSGYTTSGDDLTLANGTIAKFESFVSADNIKSGSGSVQDAIDSIISGNLPAQTNSQYRFLSTDGTDAEWVNGVSVFETASEMLASSPTSDGLMAVCNERANARYILQPSGYVALPGDITAANGRVWALQRGDDGWQVENFANLSDALSRVGEWETVSFYGVLTVTSSVTVPRGTTLKGSSQRPGEILGNWDYEDRTSLILLDPLATITLDDNATIRDCTILNSDLSGQMPIPNEATALALISSFAGTAITVSGPDTRVSNTLILGFEFAVYSDGWERVRCDFVRGDCTNGIHILTCYDISHITDCHFWPFITVHQPATLPTSTYTRSGSAYKFSDVADWCKISDSFSYGYYRGVIVTNANNVTVENVGCDNKTIADTEETIGFLVNGTSKETKLIGCQTANQEHGYYVDTSAGVTTTIMNCDAWVTETSGVLIVAGDVTINGGNIRTGVNGILINNATSKVMIDDVAITNISNLPIYASVSTSNVYVGKNLYTDLADGSSPVGSNVALKTIASAAPLLLPANGEVFSVTGTAGFGNINGGYAGRIVTLIFDDALTVSDGGTINMAGNFVTTTGDTLTLVHDGSSWYEVSRSVN